MEERRPSKPEILRAATASCWVKRGTADALEVSRSTLYRWINTYGIDWEASRALFEENRARFEESKAHFEANRAQCEGNSARQGRVDRIDRIAGVDRIADSPAPLVSGSTRPRFQSMQQQQSTPHMAKRRTLELKLRRDAADWIRHRAIDKGVPAYQVVEDLVEQEIQRERTAPHGDAVPSEVSVSPEVSSR